MGFGELILGLWGHANVVTDEKIIKAFKKKKKRLTQGSLEATQALIQFLLTV